VVSAGKFVKVHYTGRLAANDKVFDSSVGAKPFRFRLGAGDVIKGWDVGVKGMRVGGKRRILVPPEMGKELLEAAREPKDWMGVPGAGHNDVFWVAGHAYFRRIAAFARDPALLGAFHEWRRRFRYPRRGIALPVVPDGAASDAGGPGPSGGAGPGVGAAAAPSYRLRLTGLSVVETPEGVPMLQGRGRGVPIPAGCGPAVAWVLARSGFGEAEFLAAWRELGGGQGPGRGRQLLDELRAMKVLARH
jgi:hypothetical protein